MPDHRRAWAAAMLAELSHVHAPAERWRFALGCTRVALASTLTETPMNPSATLRTAALGGLVLTAPLVILESVNQTITTANAFGLFLLFGFLWLLPTLFIVTLMGVIRTARTGESTLTHPVKLILRVAFTALLASVWTTLLLDQLPCFLGVPNCD